MGPVKSCNQATEVGPSGEPRETIYSPTMNLLKIFFSPDEVFRDVAERAQWVVPFVAVLVLSLAASIVVINTIGLEKIVRDQLESNQRMADQLGEKKIEQIAQDADTPLRRNMSYGSALLGSALSMLVTAGVFTALLAIVAAQPGFKKVLGVTSYSFFAYSLVTTTISCVVLYLTKDSGNVDIKRLVNLNPSILMDPSTSNKALFSLATSFDLTSFWLIFLLGLGYSKISKTVSLGKSLGIVIGVWLIWILGKAGLSLVF